MNPESSNDVYIVAFVSYVPEEDFKPHSDASSSSGEESSGVDESDVSEPSESEPEPSPVKQQVS